MANDLTSLDLSVFISDGRENNLPQSAVISSQSKENYNFLCPFLIEYKSLWIEILCLQL